MARAETGFDGTVSIIFRSRHDGGGTDGSCEDLAGGQQDHQGGHSPGPRDGEAPGGRAEFDGRSGDSRAAAAPTPNVVTSQENASVTVPRGACRSTTMKEQAMAGARKTPARAAKAVMSGTEGVSVSGR